MALFLVGVLLTLLSVGLLGKTEKTKFAETYGVLGGPEPLSEQQTDDSAPAQSVLSSRSAIIASSLGNFLLGNDEIVDSVAGGSFLDSGEPVGPAIRGNLLIYKVRSGDTLSGIASYFGISLETLVSANPGVRTKLLHAGDELNILPVSGVVYTTKEGDTLESVSDYFNISQNQIIQYNQGISFGNLGVGTSLVIPGIKNFNLIRNQAGSLPNFNDRFVRPADGFNWGQLHNYNAVDIANSCGIPVYASAEGLVVPDTSFGDGLDGWNGGYGKFVLIEHPFGDSIRTRYAHLASVAVNIGDYVEQGQVIGAIGDTGDSTGCHVHFEVYGAKNPFTKG